MLRRFGPRMSRRRETRQCRFLLRQWMPLSVLLWTLQCSWKAVRMISFSLTIHHASSYCVILLRLWPRWLFLSFLVMEFGCRFIPFHRWHCKIGFDHDISSHFSCPPGQSISFHLAMSMHFFLPFHFTHLIPTNEISHHSITMPSPSTNVITDLTSHPFDVNWTRRQFSIIIGVVVSCSKWS